MDADYLLQMLRSYVFTITVETLVLLVALSRPHTIARRIFAGVWLTACTYPLLWLVLPVFIPLENRTPFLVVGETFVPIAECAIFFLAFQLGRPLTWRQRLQDYAAIVAANLASFLLGELIHTYW